MAKKSVDLERIGCIVSSVQDQLRALHNIAYTDVQELSRGESLQILCEHITARAHLLLDECLEQMGQDRVGGFESAFAELDERRGR